MIDVFERVFREGCGLSLKGALCSQRYEELLQCFQQAPAPGSPQEILGSCGHLVAGRLLNTNSEEGAVKLAKTVTSGEFVSGGELFPLIELLGESLIVAAKKCLPIEVMELASRWCEADAEGQIELSRQLCRAFVSAGQRSEGDLSMETVVTGQLRKMQIHFRDRGDTTVLPLQYGTWNPETCEANCQGKTQMLTAFAHLVGARCITLSPVICARDMDEIARNTIFESVQRDLRDRDLEDADPTFEDSIRAYTLDQLMPRPSGSFHVGLAMQVCDGRWVLVDPHVVCWGVFGSEWEIDRIHEVLQRYSLALPGLSLIGHDHGALQADLDRRISEAKDLIERSRRAEAAIANVEVTRRLIAIADYVASTDDLDLLFANQAAEQGEEAQAFESEAERRVAIMMILSGSESVWDLAFFSVRAMRDQELVSSRIRSWLTYYHVIAMGILGPRMHFEGKAIHPVCEFSRPSYGLAMSALNSLCYSGAYGDSESRFFLSHEFCQTSLWNALPSVHRGSQIHPEIQAAALRAVQALPFRHELTRRKLERGW